MYGRKHSVESIKKMERNRRGKCIGNDNVMNRPEMKKWFEKNNPMKNPKSKIKFTQFYEIIGPNIIQTVKGISAVGVFCKKNGLQYKRGKILNKSWYLRVKK